MVRWKELISTRSNRHPSKRRTKVVGKDLGANICPIVTADNDKIRPDVRRGMR